MNVEITLTAMPAVGKSGRFVVLASCGGVELTRDVIDLNIASNRKRFVDATIIAAFGSKSPDSDEGKAARSTLEERLLAYAKAPPGDPTTPDETGGLIEVDLCRVVRPELFHTTAVSGITVAVVSEVSGNLVSRWLTYLRWADGRREVVNQPERIGLTDNTVLYVYPNPGEPPSEPPSWSAESRRDWLAGSAAPDPAAVFRRICERFAEFLDFPPEVAAGTTATLALWSVLAYTYPAWDAVPYLSVGGPMGSGKTRVLEVGERLVFRPTVSSNTTGPCLFRTLHACGGTLFYDEAEQLRLSTPEAVEKLSVLNAGYKKGGTATRLEPVGDSFRPVKFQVFGPKALACIAGLPPTLASRSIPIMMFRTAKDSPKPKRRLDADPAKWQAIRDDLHVLALEYGPTWVSLAARADVVPAQISARSYELWQPILALAGWFQDRGANGLLGLLKKHALATVETGRDDAVPEVDELLLELLSDAVRCNPGHLPTPGELLKGAKERDETTFRTWSAAGVSRRLKTYGILPPKKINGERRYRGVTLSTMRQIAERYGLDLGNLKEPTPTP